MSSQKFGLMRRVGVALAIVSVGLMPVHVQGQTAWPPAALLETTSAQQAITLLGAAKAELAGYLLIDAPEATVPGAYRVRFRSDIPGTSHLALLRQTLDPATGAVLQQRVVVFAKLLPPGSPAEGSVEIEALGTQYLSLFAYALGRWFTVSREVKVGRPVLLD